MAPIIRAIDLDKTYRKGAVTVPALRGISFEVDEGEFVSFVGRSGSGKSTLLNCIGGLDTPSSGSLFIGGKDLGGMDRRRLARHRLKTVGMIFQSFNLISARTALENVTLALAFAGVSRRRRIRQAMDALTRVGLASRAGHKPGELSGGEAQRVAIARALINRPSILLADEPTGNLDSGTSGEIMDLLRSVNHDGTTVLMVTHDEAMAESVSRRVFRLLDGQIVETSGKGAP